MFEGRIYLNAWVEARLVINLAALLIYCGLFWLALADLRRTRGSLATRAEWAIIRAIPLEELLLLVALAAMLVASIYILHVAKTSEGAQISQMLALVAVTVRGAVAVWTRRRGFISLWLASEAVKEKR